MKTTHIVSLSEQTSRKNSDIIKDIEAKGLVIVKFLPKILFVNGTDIAAKSLRNINGIYSVQPNYVISAC